MKFNKFISSTLVAGLIFNNTSSLASVISEDTRYETFEGDNITIDNILEENSANVEIEGNTMVNVVNQKDAIPVTRSYTVEGTNHIPLQGEYDGKARPVIEGKTLTDAIKDTNMYNYKNKTTSVNSRWEMVTISSRPGKLDDKIYYRINLKVNKLETEDTALSVMTSRDNGGYKHPVAYFKDIGVGNEKEISTIRTIDENCTNLYTSLGIGCFGELPSDCTDGVEFANFTLNDFVVYNLTELFGSGNEPTQEWCDENLPYIEGIQSSFENTLITDESDENFEKYKVEYKVTGKNKFDGELELGAIFNYGNADYLQNVLRTKNYIKINPNTQYNISYVDDDINGNIIVLIYDKDFNYIEQTSSTFTSPRNASYIRFRTNTELVNTNLHARVQLEKGAVATEYEPYKEYTKTFYLSSPLLEGDTIEDIDGKATHVKRSDKIVFDGSVDEDWRNANDNNKTFTNTYRAAIHIPNSKLGNYAPITNSILTPIKSGTSILDGENCQVSAGNLFLRINRDKLYSEDISGLKKWLSENPITVVYKLAEPIYETVSEESILIDSYKDGHLDLNSNVPVNKVDFKQTVMKVNYLHPSTEYIIQFESNNAGVLEKVNLGGLSYLSKKVNVGTNRLTHTTASEITNNILVFDGIGFDASNIVVTKATDEYFNYFEGIKSVGQDDINGHKIEIKSNNKNLLDYRKIVQGSHDYGTVGKIPYYLENQDLRCTTKPEDAIPIKPNTKISIYSEKFNVAIGELKNGLTNGDSNWRTNKYTFITKPDTTHLVVQVSKKDTTPINPNEIEDGDIVVYYGYNDYQNIKHQSNQMEIPLIEPLRALPSGVKDKITKRNGQWVVERNCEEIVLNGSENWYLYRGGEADTENTLTYNWMDSQNLLSTQIWGDSQLNNAISDKIKIVGSLLYSNDNDTNGIAQGHHESNNKNQWIIQVNKSKLNTPDLDGFKKWLSENPITVVYQLKEPIYEPINISPTLNLYKDITHIYNNSNIPANMKVTVDRAINRAMEAIEIAKANPTATNLAQARYWANLLDESINKDEIQDIISNITKVEDLEIERKTVSANMDLYIKSENILSMSLNTNSITFDNYNGVEDVEEFDAVEISINSSLPYTLNAYLESPLQNSDKSETMSINLLGIRDNSEVNYQNFVNTTDKIVLKDGCDVTGNTIHSIDMKLDGNNSYKPDVYKGVVKFEATQK